MARKKKRQLVAPRGDGRSSAVRSAPVAHCAFRSLKAADTVFDPLRKADTLLAQIQALQGLKRRIPALQERGGGRLLDVVAQLVRVYADPVTPPLRKTLAGVLKALLAAARRLVEPREVAEVLEGLVKEVLGVAAAEEALVIARLAALAELPALRPALSRPQAVRAWLPLATGYVRRSVEKLLAQAEAADSRVADKIHADACGQGFRLLSQLLTGVREQVDGHLGTGGDEPTGRKGRKRSFREMNGAKDNAAADSLAAVGCAIAGPSTPPSSATSPAVGRSCGAELARCALRILSFGKVNKDVLTAAGLVFGLLVQLDLQRADRSDHDALLASVRLLPELLRPPVVGLGRQHPVRLELPESECGIPSLDELGLLVRQRETANPGAVLIADAASGALCRGLLGALDVADIFRWEARARTAVSGAEEAEDRAPSTDDANATVHTILRLFEVARALTEAPRDTYRQYGWQTLETWLVQVLQGLDQAEAEPLAEWLPLTKIREAQEVLVADLLRSLQHPQRILAKVLPPVFALALDLGRRLRPGAADAELFLPLLQQLLREPASRKGKYSAMATVVGAMDSATLALDAVPGLVDRLLDAVGPSQHIASAVVDLVLKIFRRVRKERTAARCRDQVEGEGEGQASKADVEKTWERRHWVAGLARRLLDENVFAARTVELHALPQLLEMDRGAVPHLLAAIARSGADRAVGATPVTINPNSSKRSLPDGVLWARLATTRCARTLGVDAVANGPDPPGSLLSLADLRRGARHPGLRIRLTALDLLCRGGGLPRRVLEGEVQPRDPVALPAHPLPPPAEVEVLKGAVPLGIQGATSAERHELRESLKHLLTRCRDAALAATKEAENLQKLWKTSINMEVSLAADRAQALGQENDERETAWEAEGDTIARMRDRGIRTLTHAAALSLAAGRLARWLLRLCLTQLYEEAGFLREIFALEMLHMACDAIGDAATLVLLADDEGDFPRGVPMTPATIIWHLPGKDTVFHVMPIMAVLWSEAAARRLFRLLGSTWDRTRLLAMDVLSHPHGLPKPLPGLVTPEAVQRLVEDSLARTKTPRSSHTEAGARVLTYLWRVYAVELGWTIRVDPDTEAVTVSAEATNGAAVPQPTFFGDVAVLLARRVQAMREIFELRLHGKDAEELAPHMSHGLLALLRCLVEAVDFGKAAKGRRGDVVRVRDAAQWRPVVDGIIQEACNAFAAGLLVVAEKQVLGDDWKMGVRNAQYGTSAPVQANLTSRVKVRVDCRGHAMVAAASGSEQQVLVMSSWLLLRDASGLLVALMEALPMPRLPAAEADGAQVLAGDVISVEMLTQAGDMLVDGLARLKHQGAIAAATAALQATAEAMMSGGRFHPDLCHRPRTWIADLLGEADENRLQRQNFILRRSAGFATTFVALLRAEPRDVPVVLLPHVLRVLMKTAGDARPENWRARVHALNVLRCIFLDSLLAAGGSETSHATTDALRLAAQAIADPEQWAVRNSGVMVFAAVMQRAVDNHKNVTSDPSAADGGASAGFAPTSRGKVPLADLFHRHPDLASFLVAQLDLALTTPREGEASAETHPMLVPLLVLLSRLEPPEGSVRPEAGDAMASGGPRASPDTEAALGNLGQRVRRCGHHFDAHIRSMAARALVSVTPPPRRVRVAEDLLADALAMLFGDRAPRRWNAIDGLLQQGAHLLEVCCTPLPASLIDVLRRVAAAAPTSPAPIRLRILEAWEAARSTDVVPIALAALRDTAFQRYGAPEAAANKPGAPLLAAEAARIYASRCDPGTRAFRLLLGVGSGHGDWSPTFGDARRAAILALDDRLGAKDIAQLDMAQAAQICYDLGASLWGADWPERHPPTQQRALACVCRIAAFHGKALQKAAGWTGATRTALLDWALARTKAENASAEASIADPTTSVLEAPCLVFAGLLLAGRGAAALGDGDGLRLEAWMEAVARAARSDAPLAHRGAAVRALQGSGLLTTPVFGPQLLLVLAELVQDDDEAVRAGAHAVVRELRPRAEGAGAAWALGVIAEALPGKGAVDVLTRLLAYRGERAGEGLGADLRLEGSGWEEAEAEAESGIFGREGNNLFAERLVAVQVFAPALAQKQLPNALHEGFDDDLREKLEETLAWGKTMVTTATKTGLLTPETLCAVLSAAAVSVAGLGNQKSLRAARDDFHALCAAVVEREDVDEELRGAARVAITGVFGPEATFLVNGIDA